MIKPKCLHAHALHPGGGIGDHAIHIAVGLSLLVSFNLLLEASDASPEATKAFLVTTALRHFDDDSVGLHGQEPVLPEAHLHLLLEALELLFVASDLLLELEQIVATGVDHAVVVLEELGVLGDFHGCLLDLTSCLLDLTSSALNLLDGLIDALDGSLELLGGFDNLRTDEVALLNGNRASNFGSLLFTSGQPREPQLIPEHTKRHLDQSPHGPSRGHRQMPKTHIGKCGLCNTEQTGVIPRVLEVKLAQS